MLPPLVKSSRATLLAMLLLAAAAPAGSAQQPEPAAPPAGSIHGSVIDAASSAPLPNTVVTLLPAGGNGAFAPQHGGAAFTNARRATTGSTGSYAFSDLAPGEYTLLVSRTGYAPARVDVMLGASGDARLSIGLVVRPVQLQAVTIETSRLSAGSADTSLLDGVDRVVAARARQREFLATDVREISSPDIHEAVTLGSNDVLRSLWRLPGVSHVNEGSARLWVRGNRWDHTRVYFDGVPLFEPLGARGTQSGVGAEAIGSAFLLPGVRPVSVGGDGAARVDIQSAAGDPDGRLQGSVEATFLGLGASLGARRKADDAGWKVTGRHKRWCSGATCTGFAYDEITTRADARIGSGRLEASGIHSHDWPLARGSEVLWMQPNERLSRAGHASYDHPLGSLSASHRIAGSRFASDGSAPIRVVAPPGSLMPLGLGPAHPLRSSADYLSVGSRLGSADSSSRWSAGYDLVSYASRFTGARQHVFQGELVSEGDTSGTAAIRYASVWAERRWAPIARLTLESGLRVDLGGRGLSAVRPAPAMLARYTLSPRTLLSAGAGRTHQYMQQLPGTNLMFDGVTSEGLWLAAGASNPLLVVDQATAGIERWYGEGTLLTSNLYARRSTGSTMRDPSPGPLAGRPLYVVATEEALGLEVSARKLTGAVTGMLAYSYGAARARARGYTVVAPSDRTHAVDATAMYRLGRWRFGSAYTLSTGAPVTHGSGTVLTVDANGELVATDPATLELANTRRRVPHSSLDLSVDWTRSIRRLDLTAYAGLQNVLFRNNAAWYIDVPCTGGDDVQCGRFGPMAAESRFFPSLGVRVAF